MDEYRVLKGNYKLHSQTENLKEEKDWMESKRN